MFCSKCGASNVEGAAFCSACGQPIAGATPPQSPAAPAPYSGAPAPPASGAAPAARAPVYYAGFWLRFVAYIIDSIVLGFVVGITIVLPLLGHELESFPDDRHFGMFPIFGPRFMAIRGLALMVSWIYYSLLESSAWQATLGKKALGLEVTDLEGRRISFGRATGRFFGKIVSGVILFIGFIMAGFTEKKQALHDILAGTLVIRKV
ncbi:MAG TPA: RDD family protein [Candidatus Limnocylindrales bacterium]|nr:RDD family protein [Candidatus Limnocylindrales bacterium]